MGTDLITRLGHTSVRSFQRHLGLVPDGVVGVRTTKALTNLPQTPSDRQLRPWRNTAYVIADERDHQGAKNIPICDVNGKPLHMTSAGFFSDLALQGSGIANGYFFNVAGATVDVLHEVYEPVYRRYVEYVQRQVKKGRSPKPSSYFGIRLSGDKVTRAAAFRLIPDKERGLGFGVMRRHNPVDGKNYVIPLEPWKTLAADLGLFKTSEPKYKKKGGVCPVGTKVYILEFDGMLIEGRKHDGWFTVNDTGGGIFGAHFDIFAGSRTRLDQVRLPERAHVWWEGIEARIPLDYNYGLYDR